ncbi:exosortase A [Motiliproteus sp. SC1-56]|uniref:exosortase A n=1 Tax=Motiliproteus sp. SC1-56 TaxID=2799565 RepID=UPI001A8DE8FF|nr:exosortase A [Motiliproteus sp. SC1-56]
METLAAKQPFAYDRSVTVILIGVGLVYIAVFGETLLSMATIWLRSDTYAHGALIAPISLWLIWRRRDALRCTPVMPFPPALLPLMIACAAWLAGRAANLLVIEQLAAILVLWSLILLILGRPVFHCLLFPLLYLVFAVPFGEALTPALQQVTASITVKMLQLTGIPVFMSGLYIEIPSGQFEVAEACSGIRYLIASLALGTLYAYLAYSSTKKRVLFVAASLLVPILANGIRAYMIVMIAHLSDLKYATGVDHLIYGWLFFGVVIGLMFWVGGFWSDAKAPAARPRKDDPPLPPRGRLIGTAVAGIGALLVSAQLGAGLEADTPPTPLAAYDLPLGAYESAEATAMSWRPDFKGADRTYLHTYKALEGEPISFFIADYQTEGQGKELINHLNQFFDKNAWSLAQRRTRNLVIAGSNLPVNELDLRSPDGEKRLIWQWYRANGQAAVNPATVKVLQAWSRFEKDSSLSSAFALATDYEDPQAAERHLQAFITHLWPEVLNTYE